MERTQTPYERATSRSHTRWLERKIKESMRHRLAELRAQLRAEQGQEKP
ncbi:hypothetical protein ABTX35_01500 [Streptomyces sp. NPDC096080]